MLNKATSYRNYSVRVEVDTYKGMHEGVSHLIGLGHKNIMYLQGETKLPFGEEKLIGY